MKTSDLSLAAYLMYKGFVVANVLPTEGSKRKIFKFLRKPGKKIEDVVDEYQSERALVEPRKYFNSLRDLKSRIYG